MILLGHDLSGNSNHWTLNNLDSVNDSMVDSPTNIFTSATDVGGVVQGNYATLNPLDKTSNATVTDGNLKMRVAVQGSNHFAKATIALPIDKIYFEATAGNNTGGVLVAELGLVDVTTQTWAGVKNGVQCTNGDFSKIVNGTITSLGGGGVTSGTVIGLAYDLINGLMTIYRNGTAVSSNNSIPTTYTAVLAHAYRDVSNDVGWELNFGQLPFAYTPPAGFKSLNTTNIQALGTAAVAKPAITPYKYFNTVLYTGNGSSSRSFTGFGFQPDFIWSKARSGGASDHALADAVRGVGGSKLLYTNLNSEEGTYPSFGAISSFDSDGYSINSSGAFYNSNAITYVDWVWKASGTTASNSAGTIGTSTVSVDPFAGFSIVTYTGNGVDGATVGHGLGVTPSMIIQKRRNGSIGGWRVWHKSVHATSGETNTLYLNLTYANTADADNISGANSTTFTTRGTGATNPNTNGCVAYCFSEIPGYSSFGKYTGNGSLTEGAFVYCGFRPRWVLIKTSTLAGGYGWFLWDTARDTYNKATLDICVNQSSAEDVISSNIDILSNGFKIRDSAGAGSTNGSGETYIYAAFAESPFALNNRAR